MCVCLSVCLSDNRSLLFEVFHFPSDRFSSYESIYSSPLWDRIFVDSLTFYRDEMKYFRREFQRKLSRNFTSPCSHIAVRNELPAHVTAAPSLAVFRKRLRTFLFLRSYPDIVLKPIDHTYSSPILPRGPSNNHVI